MAGKGSVRRVCLAYSGGLDTSVILRWLIEEYGCEVVAYCADIGQEEEMAGLPDKAKSSGAVEFVLRDVREEFASEYLERLSLVTADEIQRAAALYLGSGIHIAAVVLPE